MSKTTKTTESISNDGQNSKYPLLFGKKNYQLMLIGLGVIFLGFILMLGTNNTVEGPAAVFPASDIYSAKRIIIAPIVIILGFVIELYSIFLIKKSA
jgi:hypothetical protein